MAGKPGRKRTRPLKRAEALVTSRIRQLIDEAHAGNVHEASKVTGVPSPTLRALYAGNNVNPELNTLERLGRAYGFTAGWFTNPKESGVAPNEGLLFTVAEALPEYGITVPGEFVIPWASWPLPGVVDRFIDYIVALPPSTDRPIIKTLVELSEPRKKTNAMIAAYLMAPLFAAESLEHKDVLRSFDTWSTNGRRAELIGSMKKLGLFWQDALARYITK